MAKKVKYYDAKKDPLIDTNQNVKSWSKNAAGKGSKRRPTDDEAYRDNYDRIFGKKEKEEK